MRTSLLTAASLLFLFSTSSFQAQTTSVPLALSERPGGDTIQGAVADGTGGVWVVGSTDTGIATSADAMQPQSGGSTDGFLAHIGADGTLVYASYLGGTMSDHANAIARDPAGHLYIAGGTTSSDFPTTPGALRSAPLQRFNVEAFVMKLDPTGRHPIYSTYLGGSETDEAYGIAVDAAGVAHVVGMTQGLGFPVTWGRCIDGMESSFYSRISADGAALVSGTCLDDSKAYGVTLDANADAYVVGIAGRSFGPRMNAVKVMMPSTAGWQGFLAKFSGSTIPFSTYIGGSRDDWASGVAVTAKGIYIAGSGYSSDYPGAPVRQPIYDSHGTPDGTAWITKVRPDGLAILGTTLIDGNGQNDEARSLQVDSSEVVHVTGWSDSSNFPVSSDAAQPTFGGQVDAWYATAWMPNNVVGDPSYLSYLGGSAVDRARTLVFDGSGGAWVAGESNSASFPRVNAKTDALGQAFVARFGDPRLAPPPPPPGDVVLYARDAAAITGSWQPVADATAAAGTRLWNPDAGVPKIGTAAAAPANSFELTFNAQAGVPYHLWLRMKADDDSWQNDSVFVQFSDGVDASGNPVWRIGSTSATVVSLEDCSGCGEHGWGWNDNGYNTGGTAVVFAASGTHTVRIQQREDGISIDQIVLSPRTYLSAAPGANKDDTTILAQTAPDPNEVVRYAADATAAGAWQLVADTTAAGGSRLSNPDAGVPKIGTASAAPANYFEVTFSAQAGVPYHLWLRMKADADSWQNDSVFVQFSDSIDASGNPAWRIGTSAATMVSLEDCSGCGEAGWGWNDNGYNASGVLVRFATSGTHTLRVQQREDGISIDQIVLSAAKYLTAAPGSLKNDSTIVAK